MTHWDDVSLNVMENGDIVQQERYVLTSTRKVVESTTVHSQLVGGFNHFLFSIIYGIILPIDFHIFQD